MMVLGAETWSYFQILFCPGGGMIGLILWCLSIVMVSLIIENFIVIRRLTIVPDHVREQVKTYFANKQYKEAIELTANEPSFFSRVVNAGMSEARYGFGAMERAVDTAADERTSSLLRHTEWLNLLGNLGPMIGLFGTVWGLIKTFFAIVEAGGIPDPAKLASAIGIKLVCTLLGLSIAIPSLAVYGTMRNRIDTLTAEAIASAQELIANFRPVKKSGSSEHAGA
jgi:biopolymer transport protein ExbB